MQTTNGGDSWFKLNIGINFPKLIDVDLYDEGLGYMVGHDGLIIKYDTCPGNDTIIIIHVPEYDTIANRLQVVPNPIKSIATVDLSHIEFNGEGQIELMDVFGKIIKTENVSGIYKYTIERKELPAGIYFIKVQDANGHVGIGKFIAN